MTGILWILTRVPKVSKTFTFIGSYCAKHLMFHLKNTEKLSFMTLKTDGKFEEKLTCGLENDMKNIYSKLSPEHLKVSKLGLWWDLLIQSRKSMRLKFTEQLCAMATKNDTKFVEETTCCFKVYVGNFTNFDPSTQKSKKLRFNGLLVTKAYNAWAKTVQKSHLSWH